MNKTPETVATITFLAEAFESLHVIGVTMVFGPDGLRAFSAVLDSCPFSGNMDINLDNPFK